MDVCGCCTVCVKGPGLECHLIPEKNGTFSCYWISRRDSLATSVPEEKHTVHSTSDEGHEENNFSSTSPWQLDKSERLEINTNIKSDKDVDSSPRNIDTHFNTTDMNSTSDYASKLLVSENERQKLIDLLGSHLIPANLQFKASLGQNIEQATTDYDIKDIPKEFSSQSFPEQGYNNNQNKVFVPDRSIEQNSASEISDVQTDDLINKHVPGDKLPMRVNLGVALMKYKREINLNKNRKQNRESVSEFGPVDNFINSRDLNKDIFGKFESKPVSLKTGPQQRDRDVKNLQQRVFPSVHFEPVLNFKQELDRNTDNSLLWNTNPTTNNFQVRNALKIIPDADVVEEENVEVISGDSNVPMTTEKKYQPFEIELNVDYGESSKSANSDMLKLEEFKQNKATSNIRKATFFKKNSVLNTNSLAKKRRRNLNQKPNLASFLSEIEMKLETDNSKDTKYTALDFAQDRHKRKVTGIANTDIDQKQELKLPNAVLVQNRSFGLISSVLAAVKEVTSKTVSAIKDGKLLSSCLLDSRLALHSVVDEVTRGANISERTMYLVSALKIFIPVLDCALKLMTNKGMAQIYNKTVHNVVDSIFDVIGEISSEIMDNIIRVVMNIIGYILNNISNLAIVKPLGHIFEKTIGKFLEIPASLETIASLLNRWMYISEKVGTYIKSAFERARNALKKALLNSDRGFSGIFSSILKLIMNPRGYIEEAFKGIFIRFWNDFKEELVAVHFLKNAEIFMKILIKYIKNNTREIEKNHVIAKAEKSDNVSAVNERDLLRMLLTKNSKNKKKVPESKVIEKSRYLLPGNHNELEALNQQSLRRNTRSVGPVNNLLERGHPEDVSPLISEWVSDGQQLFAERTQKQTNSARDAIAGKRSGKRPLFLLSSGPNVHYMDEDKSNLNQVRTIYQKSNYYPTKDTLRRLSRSVRNVNITDENSSESYKSNKTYISSENNTEKVRAGSLLNENYGEASDTRFLGGGRRLGDGFDDLDVEAFAKMRIKIPHKDISNSEVKTGSQIGSGYLKIDNIGGKNEKYKISYDLTKNKSNKSALLYPKFVLSRTSVGTEPASDEKIAEPRSNFEKLTESNKTNMTVMNISRLMRLRFPKNKHGKNTREHSDIGPLSVQHSSVSNTSKTNTKAHIKKVIRKATERRSDGDLFHRSSDKAIILLGILPNITHFNSSLIMKLIGTNGKVVNFTRKISSLPLETTEASTTITPNIPEKSEKNALLRIIEEMGRELLEKEANRSDVEKDTKKLMSNSIIDDSEEHAIRALPSRLSHESGYEETVDAAHMKKKSKKSPDWTT